jgi:hypothetical protein
MEKSFAEQKNGGINRREFLKDLGVGLGLATLAPFAVLAQGPDEKPPGVPYTMNEIHAFWDANLNHLIIEELAVGKYHIPEIQKYFSEMNSELHKIYGKTLAIHPSWLYNENSHDVGAGNAVDNNMQPSIEIFVPAVMDVYKQYPETIPSRKKMFEVMNVTTFMHELEHLMVKAPSKSLQTREWVIAQEADTWAKTCEYVLAIFVKNGYPLGISEQYYWNDWVSCGKQNNARWKSRIRAVYSGVLDNRFKK